MAVVMGCVNRFLLSSAVLACICAFADARAYSCSSSGAKCCPRGSTCDGTLPPCTGRSSGTASSLWGCRGEAWDRKRLVMDWSYAGYKASEVRLPELKVSANIKDFGAVGDGKNDDTDAFLKAVKSVTGVLYLPAGTYVIKKQINIRRAIVLRGESRDATKLYFPNSLESLLGNSWPGKESEWAHGKCFINFMGWDPVKPDLTRLTKVTDRAGLASTNIQVEDARRIKKGQWVRITMSDPGNGAMVKSLLGSNNMDPGWVLKGARNMLRFDTRVSKVDGNTLVLERPLPWAIDTAFMPEVHAIKPMLVNAGVEHLSIEFPWTKYTGHLKEKGYNAIHFNQMMHSWIKDVRITNSDSAIYMWGSSFVTVQDVEITDSPKNRGSKGGSAWDFMDYSGHRGVWLEAGSSNKIQRINVVHKRVHDLSVATFESGSVFNDCKGEDMSLDFHKSAPYANLYTNIDMGAATHPFRSGGGQGAGPNTAGLETFWNLKGAKAITLPQTPSQFGPLLNFIGLEGVGPRDGSLGRMPFSWLLEGHPNGAYPLSLFVAMHQARLGW